MIEWWWLILAALAGAIGGMLAVAIAAVSRDNEPTPDFIDSTEGPHGA